MFPSRLKPGDTIGVAAPASPFDRDKFWRGIAVLKAMGLSVAIPELIFENEGYLAGSDKQRAQVLNQLFADPAIDAIICARGGYGSIRLLQSIDFQTIKANPKLFVGFSDISALLASFYSKCGLVTVHGPVVTTLADAPPETVEALRTFFYSGQVPVIFPENGVTIKAGIASGPVIGGNLTTLCHLMGTPFEPDFAGHILFLEEIGEALYRIDRMLTQMKLAGIFEKIEGVVLGSFEKCGRREKIYELVDHVFHDMDVPILAGLGIGHGQSNAMLPVGLQASIDAERQIFSYYESLK